MKNNPILITGAERSGSTIIAKILSLCGAFTGETTNMYEHIRTREKMESYFGLLGIGFKNQYPIPYPWKIVQGMHDFKYSIQQDLIHEGYTDNIPWMYKSSKLCQVWPKWAGMFPDAKWIIVRRRTGDIVHSCMHTAYMHSFSNLHIQKEIGVESERDGWIWWVREHEKLFSQMLEAELNCKVIWPERMVSGDFEQVKEIVQWAGLTWNDNVIPQIQFMLKNSKLKEE
jgi:hypothetical protein